MQSALRYFLTPVAAWSLLELQVRKRFALRIVFQKTILPFLEPSDMFRWVEAWSPETPLEPGQVVAIIGWAVGFWWLNSCRIIYTVDEPGAINKFGFAYGTLPGHVESGEERFLIEWDRETDKVCYDILAFSRPNHFLTRLGYPLVRRSQKRFGRDSAAAMFQAVNPASVTPKVCQSTD